jgi:hypothetical protein
MLFGSSELADGDVVLRRFVVQRPFRTPAIGNDLLAFNLTERALHFEVLTSGSGVSIGDRRARAHLHG